MEEQVKNLAVVMDGQKVGVYSFPTIKEANSFKKTTEVPPGGMILVTRGVEGLRASAISFLVDLYNQVTTESPVKRFQDKETAIRRVYAELIRVSQEKTMEETSKGGKEKAPKKERGPSYHTKIREYFKDHDTATVEEIMTLTGADYRNARVAMSIIQNSKRVKNPMKFQYVKETRTYYLLADGFGQKGETEIPVPGETAKKDEPGETKEGETETRADLENAPENGEG
jgi:hypothetical protein